MKRSTGSPWAAVGRYLLHSHEFLNAEKQYLKYFPLPGHRSLLARETYEVCDLSGSF